MGDDIDKLRKDKCLTGVYFKIDEISDKRESDSLKKSTILIVYNGETKEYSHKDFFCRLGFIASETNEMGLFWYT